MTFIVDIDDTLFISSKKETPNGIEYKVMECRGEITKVNMAYEQGHTIIIYTGRNWDQYKKTVAQLKKYGIMYHELVMGKPQGVYIDVTQCGKSIEEFLCVD